MSDTPIYDNVGKHPIRMAAHTHDHWPITVPISGQARDAITEFNGRHTIELALVLAPYGLHPHDLAQPDYRRVVYPEDLKNGEQT